MNQNVSFRRKVVYIGAIALLLIPLSWLSQPATNPSGNENTTPGGKLAQLRTTYNLSQADLGDVDPASETMKLATLGLKPVAVVLLWDRANQYKKTENWDNLRATLDQIIKIQPNFVAVWEFQGHNLSYNISVEFDDYNYRYQWVTDGIDFLMKGTRFNRNEPRLFWTVGWFVCQKIGRADERRLYRRLFRKDDEFHRSLAEHIDIERDGKDPYGQFDNWLAGRLWYLDAYSLVDTKGASMRGKAPLIYYSDAPLALINFAQTLEEEYDPGEGEIPKFAWEQAARGWHDYGSRQIRTSWGTYINLNALPAALDEVQRLKSRLDELVPEVREELYQALLDKLPAEQRAAVLKPESERNPGESSLVDFLHEEHLRVSDFDIADRADSSKRRQAKRLAREISEAQIRADRIERYRNTVNFTYWETRCAAESTDEAIRARKYLYDAHKLYEQAKLEAAPRLDADGRPVPFLKDGQPVVDKKGQPVYEMEDGAREKFENAWTEWDKVFQRYPDVISDNLAEELAPTIVEYRSVLQNLGEEELPADFKLTAILDLRFGRDGLPTSEQLRARYKPLPPAEASSAGDAESSPGSEDKQG